jgi:uncharacterized protein YecT (DUF1311 family)
MESKLWETVNHKAKRRARVLAVGAVAVALAVGFATGHASKPAGSTARSLGPTPSTTQAAPEVGWPNLLTSCDGTQQDLDLCANQQRDRFATDLQSVLAEMASPNGLPTPLAMSQSQWSDYVSTLCDSFNEGAGQASITPMLVANCFAVMTRQRIIDVCAWAVPESDLAGLANPPEVCRPYHA